MSDNSVWNTTPVCAYPPGDAVAKAKNQIPAVLNVMDHHRQYLPKLPPPNKIVVAADLIARLKKDGHERDAAHWAIHELAESGLLLVDGTWRPGIPYVICARDSLPGPPPPPSRRYSPSNFPGAVPFDKITLQTTDALWKWWRGQSDGFMIGNPAKKAIASLLLNVPPLAAAPPQGSPPPNDALAWETLCKELQAEGHKLTEINAAVHAMETEGLVQRYKYVWVSEPGWTPWDDVPDDVFNTPIPKPESEERHCVTVWPSPKLKDWWQRLRTQETSTPHDQGAAEQLTSLISRPIVNAGGFRTWLNDAEAFVQFLPNNNEVGNERTGTHNSAALCRVAECLHDLANEYAGEAAERCTLPGQPRHFSKAEVLRNIRLSLSALPAVELAGAVAVQPAPDHEAGTQSTKSKHGRPAGTDREPDPLEALPPSRKKAIQQYLSALQRNPILQDGTDQQVYTFVHDHLDEGEWLPTFATWSKYLREARAVGNARKNSPRAGRQTGRSIVPPEEA